MYMYVVVTLLIFHLNEDKDAVNGDLPVRARYDLNTYSLHTLVEDSPFGHLYRNFDYLLCYDTVASYKKTS